MKRLLHVQDKLPGEVNNIAKAFRVTFDKAQDMINLGT